MQTYILLANCRDNVQDAFDVNFSWADHRSVMVGSNIDFSRVVSNRIDFRRHKRKLDHVRNPSSNADFLPRVLLRIREQVANLSKADPELAESCQEEHG